MGILKSQLRLYLVTDPALCAAMGVVETVQRAVAGGVTMVQLRDKLATTAQLTDLALALKAALQDTGVPLVINDDVVAAVATGADGAHIGQSDISAEQTRALLGPGKILGLSCENLQTVRDADPALVDYLGLGPVFGTATKSDHGCPIGFDGLAQLVALSSLPNVAIGGLKPDHIEDILATGADGMAVVSAICGQSDPCIAAHSFDTFRPCNSQ